MSKKIKTAFLILVIVSLLGFNVQPAQAGFWGWLKRVFTKEQTEETLPAQVSEPLIKTPQAGILEEDTEQTIEPTIKTEVVEKVVIKEVPVEKVIIKEVIKEVPIETIVYENSPQQIKFVQSLEQQIKNLKAYISQLEQQLSSQQPQTIIKEVLVEVIKEVIVEVPVEKIVYQTEDCPDCPVCPICEVCQECPDTPNPDPSPSPIVGSLSIQELTTQPRLNNWKITANDEPIQITDVVFQFVKKMYPIQVNDIPWGINREIHSWVGLNYRTCAIAVSYTDWALPECLANPTDDFAQYRHKDWWGYDWEVEYFTDNSRNRTISPLPILKSGDSLYFSKSDANRLIRISGVGQNSGEIINAVNQ